MTNETAVEAIARLARVTGADYRLVGRLAGGETGAHEVRGPDGARLVVKWDDGRTAALVQRIEAFGRTLRAEQFPHQDIIHWDLHFENVLQVDGAVSAVVDNDFVAVGDGAFDLVCAAMSAADTPCDPRVRERLTTAAFAGLDPVRRNAYGGHLVIRVLDWAIRKDRPDEIEHWLTEADRWFDA